MHDFFAPCPRQVDMLKTDIEGSEFELLHGMAEASPSLPMQVVHRGSTCLPQSLCVMQ